MERESFEDDEVAEILNTNFIPIKVDREERPDVDGFYMSVCQALTGSGGWPLSAFLNNDKKPFFAGTYFPKHSRMGMNGFIEVLEYLGEMWRSNRERINTAGDEIMRALKQEEGGAVISRQVVCDCFKQLSESFDEQNGGFGGAPKFPSPQNIMFLLRYYSGSQNKRALHMAVKTLDAMCAGGIYDHIGYGFSRYSTDAKWLAPHFEKMLYDNAMLAMAYIEGYMTTKNSVYAKLADEILSYVLRDMTDKNGGFYSAEDADSEGEEGKFYLFTPDEVKEALRAEDAKKFCKIYDITVKGNFEGKSIPNLIKAGPKAADTEGIAELREKLYKYRERRVRPFKDDKILVSWNGLMIAAMSMAGRYLDKARYTDAAEAAIKFVLSNMLTDDRLMSRYRDGDVRYDAYLDDYAFLIWGLIETYETTYKPEYLIKAKYFTETALENFWDDTGGGLYVSGKDSESVPVRMKEIYDGAIPSGNAVMAYNLIRLARLTGSTSYEERALKILNAFAGQINRMPHGYVFSVIAVWLMTGKAREVLLCCRDDDEAKPMADILNSGFYPEITSLLCGSRSEELAYAAPFIKDYFQPTAGCLAYVCENFSCRAPIDNPEAFRQAVE